MNYPYLKMILQVLAHRRTIEHDIDAIAFQKISIADSGQLQNLGRLKRARRQNHLTPCGHRSLLTALAKHHRLCPSSGKAHPTDMGISLDKEVSASFGRL